MFTILHLLRNSDKLEAGDDVNVFEKKESFLEHKYPYSPFELGTERALTQDAPRYLRSHLPLEFWKDKIEKHPELKIITTTRNPKDVMVSSYHFCQKNPRNGNFNGTWADFFEMINKKQLAYGDYFEYTAAWYKFLKDRENSLLIKYEDMKSNPREYIKKIAAFLKLEVSEKVIEMITEKTTIENMVSEANNKGGERMIQYGVLRKGAIGNWKEYFTEEQNEYVKERLESFFEPIGLKFQYE